MPIFADQRIKCWVVRDVSDKVEVVRTMLTMVRCEINMLNAKVLIVECVHIVFV